jgi:hypothetical protein
MDRNRQLPSPEILKSMKRGAAGWNMPSGPKARQRTLQARGWPPPPPPRLRLLSCCQLRAAGSHCVPGPGQLGPPHICGREGCRPHRWRLLLLLLLLRCLGDVQPARTMAEPGRRTPAGTIRALLAGEETK